MNYQVIVMPAAQTELDEAYLWLLAKTPQHARLWYNGMLDAIRSLEQNPRRCRIVPQQDVPETIHQLLYGDKHHAYRILFTIQDVRVLILHIFHAARDRP
jgi:plasmid stabilization system protein ParE